MDFLKNVAYDSVVFGFSGQKLKILVIEYHKTGLFALPGGFVRKDEDLDQAVKRGLAERTGLENIYLEQFYTFGDLQRYQPEVMEAILEGSQLNIPENGWLLDRFISVAYYALINYSNVVPRPDVLSDSCQWYDLDDHPTLMLDHEKIVEKAWESLRQNIDHKVVGLNLLPTYFTMKDLQSVYEAILGEKLHRGTFQRKILASDILDRHEKQYSGSANKAPYLYSFKK